MELSFSLEIVSLIALLAPHFMSKKNKTESIQLSVRIPEQLREQLDQVCKSTGLDISVVVRACMEAFVFAYDQEQQISLPLAVIPKSRLTKPKPTFPSTDVLASPAQSSSRLNEELTPREAAVPNPETPLGKTRATMRKIANSQPQKP